MHESSLEANYKYQRDYSVNTVRQITEVVMIKVAIRVILMLVVSLTLVNADHSSNSIDYCVHIRSCCDLRTFPPKKVSSGVYKMSMGTFTSTDVYCDMGGDGGGWIVIQRNRKNSQLNFNKNWKEYEDGFGDLNEDFWAGLKLMNTLDTKWPMGDESRFSKTRQDLVLSSLQSVQCRKCQ